MRGQRFQGLWSDFGPARREDLSDLPVETVRMIATTMLVAYHVVGSSPGGGLEIGYPHLLRIVMDLLRDVRMPLFAFLAGLVFAARFVAPRELGRFFRGKIRRLAVPGAVAIGLSLLAGATFGVRHPFEGPLLGVLVYPYLHYWFLMSILLIFAVYAPLHAISRGRALLPAFAVSILLSQSGWTPEHDVFSVIGAIYLAPYFLLGAIFLRYRGAVRAHLPWVAGLAALAVAVALAVQMAGLRDTGLVPGERRDLQSLAMGFGLCLLAISLLPRLPWLDRFGPYSFTIYLYHVFGLAACRRALDAAGIDALAPHLVLGILCGMGLPILLHRAATASNLAGATILGIRPKPAPAQMLA